MGRITTWSLISNICLCVCIKGYTSTVCIETHISAFSLCPLLCFLHRPSVTSASQNYFESSVSVRSYFRWLSYSAQESLGESKEEETDDRLVPSFPGLGLPWANLIFLAIQLAHTFKMTNYQVVTLTEGTHCYFIPSFPHPPFSIHLSLPLPSFMFSDRGPTHDADRVFLKTLVEQHSFNHLYLLFLSFRFYLFRYLYIHVPLFGPTSVSLF